MGNKKQTTIEINGKRYDARTGQLMNSHAPSPAPKPASAKPRPTADGMTRRANSASHHTHKKTERSQTLMRHAVKRPAKPATLKNTQARALTDVQSSAAQKPVLHNFDAEREKRAKQIKQSSLVSRFGTQNISGRRESSKQAMSRIEPMSVKQHPSMPALAPTAPSRVESVIASGLKKADGHNEKFDRKAAKKSKAKRSPKRKLASYGAGALAILLLIGFFAYQNIPNISVRYASARSGINASLPGYSPAGFSLSNKIQYNPGQITINFSSNSDEREFSVTQRESNWNSDTLLSNYVADNSERVQRYEDKGRTIFIYNGNSATWVNGGIWYDIKGDSQLNPDQLISIATSL